MEESDRHLSAAKLTEEDEDNFDPDLHEMRIARERTAKYWICADCAKEKKWVEPKWPVTCTSGMCGWCDRKDETMLTPCVDFSGPGKKAIWD